MVPFSFRGPPEETGAIVLVENKVIAQRPSLAALQSAGRDRPCGHRGWVAKITSRGRYFEENKPKRVSSCTKQGRQGREGGRETLVVVRASVALLREGGREGGMRGERWSCYVQIFKYLRNN